MPFGFLSGFLCRKAVAACRPASTRLPPLGDDTNANPPFNAFWPSFPAFFRVSVGTIDTT